MKLRLLPLPAAILAVLLLASGQALAEKRIALVIGNGTYPQVGDLANPPNDARLMARTLRQVGFEVIERIDADQKAMKRAIKAFGEKLQDAGKDAVGLFYYAGHGVQVGGVNYLIPVNVNIDDEADVDIEAVSANVVQAQMAFAGSRLNIIIMDACRNNPFKRSFRAAVRGLARMDATKGTLIAYATGPGDVAADGRGANSPYTEALAKAILTPGLTVERMFKQVRNDVVAATNSKQVPWESSSLTGGDFYFKGGVSTAAAPVQQTAQPQSNLTPDMMAWQSIRNSTNPKEIEAFILDFRDSPFVGMARARHQALKNKQYHEAETASLPPTVGVTSKPAPPKGGNWQKVMERALKAAGRAEAGQKRTWAYAEVAIWQAEIGDIEGARQSIGKAERTLSEAADSDRDMALQYLASALAAVGDTTSARKTAAKMSPDYSLRHEASAEIGLIRAKAGDMDGARRAFKDARRVATGDINRLITVARIQAKTGDKEGLERIIEDIQATLDELASDEFFMDYIRALRLSDIAGIQARAGNLDAARRAARKALRVIGPLKEPDFAINSVYSTAARVLAVTGDMDGAFNAVKSISDLGGKVRALVGIAWTRARGGDKRGAVDTMDEARRLMGGKTDIGWWSDPNGEIALVLAEAGDVAGARRLADGIDYAHDRAHKFLGIAEIQARAGDVAGARRSLDDALDSADLIDGEINMAWTMSRIAAFMAKLEGGLTIAMKWSIPGSAQ